MSFERAPGDRRGTVLVVDDEPALRFTLSEVLEARGHEVLLSGSGAEALTMMERADVVISDLAMPEMDGLALLSRLHERDRELPVIILTAQGSERAAVEAMKGGAYDYLTKPFDNVELCLTIERALETRGLRRQVTLQRAEHQLGHAIVGDSPALRATVAMALRLADKKVPVLIRGETGTGKELFASLLHAASRRRDRALVRFNCAAVPETIAESELFGHAKGAFTGATHAQRGYFARAAGGTLVLDEVGELSLSVQSKLLRAAQDGELQPVGAAQPERVDVRLISSTHRDLLADTKTGRFREDLYYRLAVVELVIPPLRERREDIPRLASTFATRAAARFEMEPVSLTSALLARLSQRDWPGNVRELENTVVRLVALSNSAELDADALEVPASVAGARSSTGTTWRERVDAFERALLQEALDAANGNQSEVARALALSRGTVIEKMKRLGLLPR